MFSGLHTNKYEFKGGILIFLTMEKIWSWLYIKGIVPPKRGGPKWYYSDRLDQQDQFILFSVVSALPPPATTAVFGSYTSNLSTLN
jgi:hypothetical protein